MIKLVTNLRGDGFLIAPRTFGKLLHLARFHGWRPEKVSHDWPSGSWDTEIVLPHLGPYMPGPVSESDGFALSKALRQVMISEPAMLQAEEYLGLLILLKATAHGAFEVEMVTAEAPAAKPTPEAVTA
jgi:hypothetical protein